MTAVCLKLEAKFGGNPLGPISLESETQLRLLILCVDTCLKSKMKTLEKYPPTLLWRRYC